jgi:hypothetical protein
VPFSELMNDNVELRKSNGAVEVDLKASVQGARIYMDAGKLPIESGDIIIRRLSTGVRETYRVTDPSFHEAFMDFPAHYQMKVLRVEELHVSDDVISEERKQALFRQWEEIGLDIIKLDLGSGGHRYVGGPPATRKLAMQWVRMKDAERVKGRTHVNVSGQNARVNIGSTDQSTNVAIAGNLFASIREAISTQIHDPEERATVTRLLDRTEAAKDKASFLSAYQILIAAVADHMTVLSPFLPALTQLIHEFSK